VTGDAPAAEAAGAFVEAVGDVGELVGEAGTAPELVVGVAELTVEAVVVPGLAVGTPLELAADDVGDIGFVVTVTVAGKV
jgi:hypothetical protein